VSLAVVRQITGGPYQDIHPFYLPDGKIGFVSTRVKAYTMCQPGAEPLPYPRNYAGPFTGFAGQ